MMAKSSKSKWIENVSADNPVEKVAATALEGRLDRVCDYLDAAAGEGQGGVEDVHQLRVSTRRALAAMDIFAPLLPPRRAIWINKKLNRIRKAAGDARDFDVLAARVAGLAQEDPEGPFMALLEQVELYRQEAQQPICHIQAKLRRKNFEGRARELCKRVHLRSKFDKLTRPTYGTTARQALQPLVEVFCIASTADSNNLVALHAFRIQGKRLRYAMEIFAGALAPLLRNELYPIVEELQEKLGHINDHATAQEHLGRWHAASDDEKVSAALRAMIEREKIALEESRRAYLDWWTPARRDDLHQRFRNVLVADDGTLSCDGSGNADGQNGAESARSRRAGRS